MGTQKNRLSMFRLMGKKIITIFAHKISLSVSMVYCLTSQSWKIVCTKYECFCLNLTFLPVTCSFDPFRIRRGLIFELICESIKIYAFKNPDSTCWTASDVLFLPQ